MGGMASSIIAAAAALQEDGLRPWGIVNAVREETCVGPRAAGVCVCVGGGGVQYSSTRDSNSSFRASIHSTATDVNAQVLVCCMMATSNSAVAQASSKHAVLGGRCLCCQHMQA
jgi:hypothetical protein